MRFGSSPIGSLRLIAIALTLQLLSPAARAASLYDPWPNGPPHSPDFFPIAVWYQAPAAAGSYGKYGSQAAAAAGEHINIFMAFAGRRGLPHLWPERFGGDEGELEAIKAHHLYAIGGLETPYTENTSPLSVASALALAKSIGATANLIGYNAGDEPDCKKRELTTAMMKSFTAYDPTRVIAYNQLHWMTAPAFEKCLDQSIATLQAVSIASADLYPLTDPWVGNSLGFPKSDFLSVPNDTLFMQGIMTEGLIHYGRRGQPVWPFVDSGSDELGMSLGGNAFDGAVDGGSNVLTMAGRWSKFTAAWIGLAVSGKGLPPHTRIVGVKDETHAVMSSAAAAASAHETIRVTGGVHDSDCIERLNLCVVQGNEYRATPAQVNAEVWTTLINGAHGIEYFCHDRDSAAFCLGDTRAGRAAAIVQQNLTFINATVLKFAPVLNAPTTGMCSMQHQNYTTGAGWSTTRWCANGVLTMTTANPLVPGLALVKQLGPVTYVLAQSDRRSAGGAVFAFKIAGTGSKTAKIVYDSDARYDPVHSAEGRTFRIDGAGGFSDTIGAENDDYQVKIYAID
jgi:hypothetical protein